MTEGITCPDKKTANELRKQKQNEGYVVEVTQKNDGQYLVKWHDNRGNGKLIPPGKLGEEIKRED